MARHPMMRTPDGAWSVEVLTTRGGQVFRVKRAGVATSTRGWTPIGQIRETVAEVAQMLGPAFAELMEVRS